MKYRPHRRLLDESMAEVVELPDRAALVAYLTADLEPWFFKPTDADFKSERQGYDERISWDTYFVLMKNMQNTHGNWYFGDRMGPDYWGVIGYTDQAF